MRAPFGRGTVGREILYWLFVGVLFLAGPAPAADKPAKSEAVVDPAVEGLRKEVATRGWILFDAMTEKGDRGEAKG